MTAPRPPATILPIDKASPEAQSVNPVEGNLAQLKALFPEAFTEGRVDFEVLKQLLGAAVDGREEKYGLNWHGKRRARQLALTPSTGTLRPCPEESVDWDTTQNLFIEGDNLEVLKLLQKSYAGKVKLIYIDPPYNTGKDFVYPDNFQDSIKNYLEITGQVEGGQKISSNTEASGRFHTALLNMMYPRLKLARSLLREDGAIFVSIDGNEIGDLLMVMNDVFGEENCVVQAVWEKRVSPANDAKWFSSDHDFVVVYAKNKELWRPRKLERSEAQLSNYKNPDNDPRGPWNSATYTCNKSREERPNLYYPIRNPQTGEDVWPKETAVWKYGPEVTAQQLADGRLYWGADGRASFPRAKLFLSEMDNVVPRSVWSYEDVGHTQQATTELKELFGGKQVFDSPKPVKLLKRILELGCDGQNDIVLDFFAGSGTTAHACFSSSVEGSSVRFILVQIQEPLKESEYRNIAEITKARLRLAAESLTTSATLACDFGFKTFRLDSSNIRAWNPSPEDLQASLVDHAEHLLHGREEQDVLYELLLKLGLDLSVPMESRQIAGKTVHSIGAGALMACLSDGIDRDVAEPLALGIAAWQKAQAQALQGGDDNAKPVSTKLVFKDSAFADDVAKTNLAAILSQHGLDDVRSI